MTTATKTPVTPTWPQTKTQEATARMAAANCSAAFQTLSKYGEEAMAEFQKTSKQFRIESLKAQGVKTANALELAKALAEQEVNLFGSKIDISGDEKEATLTYNYCAMWEAMKKLNKMTPEQEEKMGAGFQACMQSLAQEFGTNASVKFEGDTCAVSFTKA